MKYELHNNLDVDFPLIFGCRVFSPSHPDDAYLHWHDCIEVIYCEYGQGCVISGGDRIFVEEGDIVIVNSGDIHDASAQSECRMYYLDLGSALYSSLRLAPHLFVFKKKIRDNRIEASIRRIITEMKEQNAYYKQAVQIEIVSIIILLMREYLNDTPERRLSGSEQVQAVKKTISYLREHFLEQITMEELCANIGYSKYYLCHSFKKMTGSTIIQHVNYLKCQHARSLLLDGCCNVSESAVLSGFKNNSYFSRTYRSVFGRLPSDDLPAQLSGRLKVT